jgi:hypothetical protein
MHIFKYFNVIKLMLQNNIEIILISHLDQKLLTCKFQVFT